MLTTIADVDIGTNINLERKLKTAAHYDLVVWNNPLDLDGKTVIDKGKISIN